VSVGDDDPITAAQISRARRGRSVEKDRTPDRAGPQQPAMNIEQISGARLQTEALHNLTERCPRTHDLRLAAHQNA
jgi:hypothetical protein